jgi:hypothetical protein
MAMFEELPEPAKFCGGMAMFEELPEPAKF